MPHLYFLLCFLFIFPISAYSFHDDQQSLLGFKKLITSDPNHSMSDWIPAVPFCNWTAVICSRRHPNRVVSLNLTHMDLRGTISPSLGNLSFLRSLDLSSNALEGHIPAQLGRLFRLKCLCLYNNHLKGNIPSQLSGCRNLVELALSFNNLSGNIPGELGSLRHLQKLYLAANSLTGTIPSSLGNLSALIDLDIAMNSMVGAIPPQLGSLMHLQVLYLHENDELSSTIPISLCNISSMTELAVHSNKLTGSIPQKMALLTRLEKLYLHDNEFSGPIPPSLANISSLTRFAIYKNKLTGSIPKEFGVLPCLEVLYLNNNELSGGIPRSLGNITSLSDLPIYTNKLTGPIPQELGILTNLQFLRLQQNELEGAIPSSLFNITNLRELDLFGNYLSGNIPNFIGNSFKLENLILCKNYLTGSVPIELGKLYLLEKLQLHDNQLDSGNTTTMDFLVSLTNCSHLQQLYLHKNKLSGVFPFAIGKLSKHLSILSLSGNMIEENIPPHIGNLTSLTYLNLSENNLDGIIPPLGNLMKLERLYLGNNRLEGNIPNDFEQLHKLGLLDISRNILSGKIPSSLAPLKQLRRLILHHNQLSGDIPASLGNCINLELLDLSHNMLTGSIPQEIVELYNLQFYLNLSWNLLEGSLPMAIGKIAMAQAIDISANHLTGVIPPTLGSCSELQSLNLSRNSFKGSIPDLFANLQSLVNLDLSSNSLLGTIPVTLKQLKMLKYLNLSFNNLTGEIRKEGIFANPTIVMSVIGNPGLCGPQVFDLPACPTPRDHFSFVKKVLFPVSGAIGFILCILLGFFWRRNFHVQNFVVSQSIFQRLEHQRISYQELHIATNGFAKQNLLGTSNFGSVYKGILSDGTLIAVKVFQLVNDQAEKSFKAECSALQKVRHRNLVKILTSCSKLHFKGLVFQFMYNGSLEKHLYPNRDDNNGEDLCELGLQTRLDILIDVAHAMVYLHHYSYVQVVHCDMKPSNVLLDEDMTGHVTDFGISRLIDATSSDSPTSTLALKGSIGYIAPEYGLGQAVSTKGDVYSYGILLLEMITRKRPTSDMFVGELNLHKWVNLAFPNKVNEVIDNNIFSELDRDKFDENNVHNCLVSLLRVGLLCSKDSPVERPTMREMVMVLESLKEDLVPNEVHFRRSRQSISNLLGNTNTPMDDAPASNDQSSSTF